MQKILFLISDTGGGHRANAVALRDACEFLFPHKFEYEIIDVLVDYSFWPMSKAPQMYSYLSTKRPWLWKLLFGTQKLPKLTRGLANLLSFFFYKKLYKKFVDYNPSLIVSIHPLVQEFALKAISKMPKKIPFAVVCTDLSSAHHLWFHKDVDAMYVVCDEVVEKARKVKIPEHKICLSGLPIRAQFKKEYPSKEIIRKELDMDYLPLPAVMLFGGGDGVGPMEEIAYEIDEKFFVNEVAKVQLVIMCGRNTALLERLQKRNWNIPVKINGFLENVAQWMNAVDIVVAKAGPGVIAESMSCGLPMILYGFIPGQEEGNVSYVVDHEIGLFIKDSAKIAEKINEWITTENTQMKQFAINAKKLSKPNSSEEIVKSLEKLIN